MSLTGDDIEELVKKLAGALNKDQLAAFVHASTGDRLFVEFVGEGKPLKDTIRDLLNALEVNGATVLFLRYVYVHKPGKPELKSLIAEKCPEAITLLVTPSRAVELSVQEGGNSQQDAPTNAAAPGFQRNVVPYLPHVDVRLWVERLLQIERRVCRIELDEVALGTGFLVGPDTILTNWHVVEQAEHANKIHDLGCRFDYVRLPNGTLQAGQLIRLHAEGCVNFSRYAQAETTKTPETPAPAADELDYALLRLAVSVGLQTVEGANRGWIVLPKLPMPLPKDAPLLIVQHPQGIPMKLALDTKAVIGRNSNGTRVRYRTNTDAGSSGSPCFTLEWDIVALHHYGDPNWQAPLFNQGIPIELIRQRIEANGLGKMLDAIEIVKG